jgi:hypothetical protein
MPNLRARLRRRHNAHGWEILLAIMAVGTGLSFIAGTGDVPAAVEAAYGPFADIWGGAWLVASIMVIVGVLSGAGNVELGGLILFDTLIWVFFPALIVTVGPSFGAVIVGYAGVVILNRINEIRQVSRELNRANMPPIRRA